MLIIVNENLTIQETEECQILEKSQSASAPCDSSNCAYCHFMMQHSRPSYLNSDCWLRRKRSESDLSAVDSLYNSELRRPFEGNHKYGTCQDFCAVPDTGENQNANGIATSLTTIWDHALMESENANKIFDQIPDFLTSRKHREFGAAWQNCSSDVLLGDRVVPWQWKSSFIKHSIPVLSRAIPIHSFIGSMFSNGNTDSNSHLHSSTRQQRDIISGLEWEPHGWLLASAGISKQVKIFSFAQTLAKIEKDIENLNEDDSIYEDINCRTGSKEEHFPVKSYVTQKSLEEKKWHCTEYDSQPLRVHRLASKLSGLSWNPDAPGMITIGDYDGGVIQIDVESGHLASEIDGHHGRRVWSISHSYLRPHFAASGSEDGTVALWSGCGFSTLAERINIAHSINRWNRLNCFTTPKKISVSGVQLSPFDENKLAVACADAMALVFDLRRTDIPYMALNGHSRALSNVKYMDKDTIVTAATDSSLCLWDLTSEMKSRQGHPKAPGLPAKQHVKQFSGHVNSKNFVGLSLRSKDRLIACGSEDGSVFTYCSSWEEPVMKHNLVSSSTSPHEKGLENSDDIFCSAVAWQPQLAHDGPPILAAAASDGVIQILAMMRSENICPEPKFM